MMLQFLCLALVMAVLNWLVAVWTNWPICAWVALLIWLAVIACGAYELAECWDLLNPGQRSVVLELLVMSVVLMLYPFLWYWDWTGTEVTLVDLLIIACCSALLIAIVFCVLRFRWQLEVGRWDNMPGVMMGLLVLIPSAEAQSAAPDDSSLMVVNLYWAAWVEKCIQALIIVTMVFIVLFGLVLILMWWMYHVFSARIQVLTENVRVCQSEVRLSRRYLTDGYYGLRSEAQKQQRQRVGNGMVSHPGYGSLPRALPNGHMLCNVAPAPEPVNVRAPLARPESVDTWPSGYESEHLYDHIYEVPDRSSMSDSEAESERVGILPRNLPDGSTMV